MSLKSQKGLLTTDMLQDITETRERQERNIVCALNV